MLVGVAVIVCMIMCVIVSVAVIVCMIVGVAAACIMDVIVSVAVIVAAVGSVNMTFRRVFLGQQCGRCCLHELIGLGRKLIHAG
jgi:hypothetical protein